MLETFDSSTANDKVVPRLSIIVPVLNEAMQAYAQLRLLAPLRRCGVEVIAVDGGSTDDTLAVARRHAGRAITVPGPLARQLNVAAAFASGEVLLLVGAGVVLPAFIDQLIDQAMQDDRCLWGRIDLRISGTRWRRLLTYVTGTIAGRRAERTSAAPLFVSRKAFMAVGGIPPDASLPLAALAARLCAAGHDATRVRKPARARSTVRHSSPVLQWSGKHIGD